MSGTTKGTRYERIGCSQGCKAVDLVCCHRESHGVIKAPDRFIKVTGGVATLLMAVIKKQAALFRGTVRANGLQCAQA